jgi:pyruvate dehydrogenase E1 component alpha subunit
MGTAVSKAVSVRPIAEKKAGSFGLQGYTLDGMDFFNCYAGFKHVHEEVLKNQRPVLVEVITERFKGHSISDPGLYRSKADLSCRMERDPLGICLKTLSSFGMLSNELYESMDKEAKERVMAAIKFAEESPWPDPIELGEGVFK